MQSFHFPQQDHCKIMEFDIFVSDLNKSHKPFKVPVCALESNPSCHGTSPLEALGLYLGSKSASLSFREEILEWILNFCILQEGFIKPWLQPVGSPRL